jgi:signal transduction histidine kinase
MSCGRPLRTLDVVLTLVRDRAKVLKEVAIVAVLGLVTVGGTAVASTHQRDDGFGFGVVGVALLATAVLALPFRHRYPVAVLAVALGTIMSYWSLGYARGPVFFPLIVALVTVVLRGHRLAAVTSLVVGFVGVPWGGYLLGRVDERPTWGQMVLLAAWLITLISVSEMVRYRRDRAEAAALTQAEALRRRTTEERLRIARELHDVVAHNMSLISIQAGVALHLMDQQPEQARTSLTTI